MRALLAAALVAALDCAHDWCPECRNVRHWEECEPLETDPTCTSDNARYCFRCNSEEAAWCDRECTEEPSFFEAIGWAIKCAKCAQYLGCLDYNNLCREVRSTCVPCQRCWELPEPECPASQHPIIRDRRWECTLKAWIIVVIVVPLVCIGGVLEYKLHGNWVARCVKGNKTEQGPKADGDVEKGKGQPAPAKDPAAASVGASTASEVGCLWRVVDSSIVVRKDISLDSDPVHGVQLAVGDVLEQISSAIKMPGKKSAIDRIQIKDDKGNVGWTTLHSKFLEKAVPASVGPMRAAPDVPM